jgi:hypothetical protein
MGKLPWIDVTSIQNQGVIPRGNQGKGAAMPAPTILIGLGGLGSSIVQSVHARVPEEYRSLVGVHILDTDSKELSDKRYESLDEGNITQTSRDITVKTCLDYLADQTRVLDWFPAKQVGSRSMLDKKMPLGASQVRVISRLALLDTMFGNRLDDFNKTLGKAIKARGEQFRTSVRVVIVNSIAGGTGSGAFLQVALYISEYFKRNLGVESPVIRGVVVMPEVFVRAGDYKGQDLTRNVRANGYAAIKELDGLIRVRSGQLDPARNPELSPLFPLELEYRVGQKDSAVVAEGPSPFDYVFLYSELNSRPALLGNKDNYIRQATDALYLQLFSPLEGRGGIYSQEDNLIRTLVQSGDRARYASTGIARVVYPHSDIVSYCALQWAIVGVSQDWLEIDDLIDDELKQNDQDRKMGIFREKPERYSRFVEILRQKAQAEKPSPFYVYVFREAYVPDEDGRPGTAKSSRWIHHLGARIEESFAQAKQEAMPTGALNIEQLKDKDTVVSQVERFEKWLTNYRERLVKGTQPLANMIVKEALWDDWLRRAGNSPVSELRLGYWLAAKDGAVHPVAVRYFLGDARIQMERDLVRLESSLDKLDRQLDNYQKRDWDAETEELDSPQKYATKLANSHWLKHAFQRPLVNFAEEYQAEAEAQRDRITAWARAKLEHGVYGAIRNQLRDMLSDWESFFNQLDAVLNRCKNDLDILGAKHDNNTDPTRIFVCASTAHKQALWETECVAMRSREMPEGVCRQIYLSLYERRARQHFDEAPRRVTGWEEKLFMDHVVGWCRQEMGALSGLDLDIKAAMDTELRYDQGKGLRLGQDEDAAFRAYVTKLENLAYPCLPVENQNFQFWCVNADVARRIGNRLLSQTIGMTTPAPQTGAPPAGTVLGGAREDASAYSRYELILMRMTYGLRASDLPSIANEDGIYRQAYEEIIGLSRSSPPMDYTPHLDWRWDSPAFLPELDDAVQRQAMLDLRRAVFYSMVMSPPIWSRGSYDGQARWERFGNAGEVIPLTGARGETLPATLQGLYEGLAVHFWLVKKILSSANDAEAKGRKTPKTLPIIKDLAALLDQLLAIPKEARTPAEGESLANLLIHSLFEEVRGILERAYGKPNQARDETRILLNEAIGNSAVLADLPAFGLEPGWKERLTHLTELVCAPSVS